MPFFPLIRGQIVKNCLCNIQLHPFYYVEPVQTNRLKAAVLQRSRLLSVYLLYSGHVRWGSLAQLLFSGLL